MLKGSIFACTNFFELSENSQVLKGSILAYTKFFGLSENKPVLKGSPFELARKFWIERKRGSAEWVHFSLQKNNLD